MRVAGQLKIHGIFGHDVGYIRLVYQEYDGAVIRNLLQSLSDIVLGWTVSGTAYPQALSQPFDKSRLIDQYLQTLLPKVLSHANRVCCVVMIAKNCQYPRGRAQLGQDLGTGFCSISGGLGVGEKAVRKGSSYKIPGEHDEIGTQGVCNLNGALDGNYREVRIVVKITELGDGVSVKSSRKPR